MIPQEGIIPFRSVPDSKVEAQNDELASAVRTAAAVLRDASSVTVVCHENPDADTLGGGLAVARALDRLGITVEVVCSTRWPSTLAFLPDVEDVLPTPQLDPDAIVLVDCASIERAGASVADWIRGTAAVVVNVDHHVSNNGYGSASCIDRSAAATSEVVARLVAALGCPLDLEIATLLLAGILHDTGGLTVPETSAATLRLAADLVDAGAQLNAINRELFGRRPLAALHLWGRVASGLETSTDGRIVVGTLTNEMLALTGAALLDAEDLPELIASAQDSEIGLLLRESRPNETRVSIRTLGSVNAADVAMEFGGGGHDHAGGCTISAGLGTARHLLIEACERHLARRGLEGASERDRGTVIES